VHQLPRLGPFEALDWRRGRMIWRRRHRWMARGERCGRLERSGSPTSPPTWYRRHHRRTAVVLRSIPSATSRSRPPASTSAIARSASITLANACAMSPLVSGSVVSPREPGYGVGNGLDAHDPRQDNADKDGWVD
jgi:hypothetical protein